MSFTGLLMLIALLAGGGLLIFLFDRLFRPDGQKHGEAGGDGGMSFGDGGIDASGGCDASGDGGCGGD